MNEEQAEWTIRNMGYGIQIEPSICWVGFGTGHSEEEHRENAQLILCSKELLAGLRMAVVALNHLPLHMVPQGSTHALASELETLIEKATQSQ